MATTVVNLKRDAYDVYIGRGSIWGNPFHIGPDMTRDQSLTLYRERLMKRPDLLAQIHTLKNRILGCYCKPWACHGDILAELADAS